MISEKVDFWRPKGKKKRQIRDSSRDKKKIQDSETQKSPEKETSRHIKNAYEISRSGQNFARPTFFEGPFFITIMQTLDM